MARQKNTNLEKVNERQYCGYTIAKYGKYYYNWYFAVELNGEEVARFKHLGEAEDWCRENRPRTEEEYEFIGEEEVIYDASQDEDEFGWN